MPELPLPFPSPPPQPQPHAKTLREEALIRLSRSPHPYHRQQSELPHSSERINANTPPPHLPQQSTHTTDDERPHASRRGSSRYRDSTGSDSGTEADDEHFLKGLPAPKLRPHKGLRGVDGTSSSSPSPRMSPTPNEDAYTSPGVFRRSTLPSELLTDEEARKAAEKFRQKRRVEIVRRTTETGLLVALGGIICLDPNVRRMLWFWKRELACQCIVTTTLLTFYPLRLLRRINPSNMWQKPYPIVIPAVFDPAPLLYPPLLTFLVSSLLSTENWLNMMPTMILGIASLPRDLIPSTGGLTGSNLSQWFLSCFPLFFSAFNSQPVDASHARNPRLKGEILVLIPPLHQALCVTLQYLTTTSLLEAELQLLSIALIHLLLLAISPQALILKSLLWGGGIGVLVTCSRVLQWGVILARVPKWRFRRSDAAKSKIGRGLVQAQRTFELGKLGSMFAIETISDTSDDGGEVDVKQAQRSPPNLKLNMGKTFPVAEGKADGSMSAVEPKRDGQMNGNGDDFFSFGAQRRHTLPSFSELPPKPSKKTSSGRKKRAQSSTIQAFFSLTQKQAAVRKWVYAGYVYLCILIITLIGIREYVGKYALYGNEPVGWALGYLFGDLPWFRMQVVLANLQRWICLPPRSGLKNSESCYSGWVEHLRHATFGEANTRLLLCLYWLAIIIVGLAVVFRLSAIYEVDTRRKVFHFMMVAMLLPATYVDPTFAALALSLMLAIFLLLDLFRASQLPPLSKSLAYFLTPYVDGRDLKGPVVISHIFLLIGCAIPLWLSLGALPRTGAAYLRGWEVPTREVSMVSGVICVGMGDAAASLIGRRYGRRKWLWGGGKSIEGSVAFATAVALALGLAKAWLRIGGWKANNDDGWGRSAVKSVVCAGLASATEAVLTGGNDNVVCPVVLWVCVRGMNL